MFCQDAGESQINVIFFFFLKYEKGHGLRGKMGENHQRHWAFTTDIIIHLKHSCLHSS